MASEQDAYNRFVERTLKQLALGLKEAHGGGDAAGSAADGFAARSVPDFPFKPDTFFAFSPALVVTVLALAVVACVIGALPPAYRAAAGDPSEALAGR